MIGVGLAAVAVGVYMYTRDKQTPPPIQKTWPPATGGSTLATAFAPRPIPRGNVTRGNGNQRNTQQRINGRAITNRGIGRDPKILSNNRPTDRIDVLLGNICLS